MSALAMHCGAILTPPISPELRDWSKRGGAKDLWWLRLVDVTFVGPAKARGDWAQFSALHFLATPNLTDALVNAVSTSFPLTVTGTVTHTPHTGIQGDGLTGKLTYSGAAASDLANLNTHTLLAHCQSDNPGIADDLGAISASAHLGIRFRNAVQQRIYSNSNNGINSANIATSRGMSGLVRTSSAGGYQIKDGAGAAFVDAAAALPTGSVRIFELGAATNLSSQQISIVLWSKNALSLDSISALTSDWERTLDALGTLVPDTPPEPLGANVWTNTTIDSVTPSGLSVIELAAPPPSDAEDGTNYPYFPSTDVATRPWGGSATSTQTTIRVSELLWVDRGLGEVAGTVTAPATKGNDTMGTITFVATTGATVQGRTLFSTYDKAIGSTLVKAAYSAGLAPRSDVRHADGKGWLDIADDWGYDTSGWASYVTAGDTTTLTTNANVDTGGVIIHRAYAGAHAVDEFTTPPGISPPFWTCTDRVIVGQGRLIDITQPIGGYYLDLEPGDGRGAARLLTLVRELRKICDAVGFSLGWTGEAVNSGVGGSTGWALDNVQELTQTLFDRNDLITSFAPPGGDQYAWLQSQWDFCKGTDGTGSVDPSRMVLHVQLGTDKQGCTIADAHVIRQFILDKGLGAVCFVRVFGVEGGPLTTRVNQVKAIILGLPTS